MTKPTNPTEEGRKGPRIAHREANIVFLFERLDDKAMAVWEAKSKALTANYKLVAVMSTQNARDFWNYQVEKLGFNRLS